MATLIKDSGKSIPEIWHNINAKIFTTRQSQIYFCENHSQKPIILLEMIALSHSIDIRSLPRILLPLACFMFGIIFVTYIVQNAHPSTKSGVYLIQHWFLIFGVITKFLTMTESNNLLWGAGKTNINPYRDDPITSFHR